MLGMGPIMWDQCHRELYRFATPDPPVTRIEAEKIDDPFTDVPKYRYAYPAAREYYQRIDALSALQELKP